MSVSLCGHKRIGRRSLLRCIATALDNLDRWSLLPGGPQPFDALSWV
jgi:hypothetical protein